jgi:hypothetical protein
MTRLAELVQAENRADADRRAVGRVPDVLRPPGAAHEAYERWEAAHRALTEAREAETDGRPGIEHHLRTGGGDPGRRRPRVDADRRRQRRPNRHRGWLTATPCSRRS